DFSKLVGEPLRAGERLDGARLFAALWAFQDQHVIDLGAGLHDAGNARDHPARADGAVERSILRPKKNDRPSLQPRHAVPAEAHEIIADGVDADRARDRADAAADGYGRDIDRAERRSPVDADLCGPGRGFPASAPGGLPGTAE